MATEAAGQGLTQLPLESTFNLSSLPNSATYSSEEKTYLSSNLVAELGWDPRVPDSRQL
jgi:hypothetical protein